MNLGSERPRGRYLSMMSSVALVALTLGGAAHAQSTPPSQATSDTPSTGPTEATTPAPTAAVGEVVVTAQRRSESIQRVPLSITAITGQELRNQDVSDISRLEQIAPGLRLGRSGPVERPAIRGVYTEAIGINSDPRIGFYIDEIYQSRPQQTTATLVDLERVEVQKGPQGTLFGRNSYGGNIALSSATPKNRVEGGLDVTGGNYGRFRAEGYYNAPLLPGLDGRIAAEYERHDGYLQSVIDSAADLEDKQEVFVRGSLRWVPPQLGGKLEVLARASYYMRDDNGFNNANAKVIGVLVDPKLITPPGGTLNFNSVPYTFANGYNGLSVGTGVLYPYTNAFRDNIPDVGGADIGLPIPGKLKTLYDFAPKEDLEQQQFSLTASYELGPLARLRSITSYTKFSTVNTGDGDGAQIPLLGFAQSTGAETYSQELQLQSNDRSRPLQYTVGGFYLYDSTDESSNYYLVNAAYTTAGAAGLGFPAYYSFGGNNACTLNYAVPATGCAVSAAGLAGNGADQPGAAHALTRSIAGYAQASYTFFDKLTFTLGARYTVDKKSYKNIGQTSTFVSTYVAAQNAAATAAGQPLPFPNAAGYRAYFPAVGLDFANLNCGGFTPGTFAAAGQFQVVGAVPNYFVTRCGARSFEFATYRAAVDYKITPRNLVYASFNTGVHSGGFGTSPLPTTTPQGLFTTFNSEGVEAYEVGTKNQFFDGKLQANLAVFYNRYSNLQQQGLQQINGRNIATIFNGPSGDAPGFDLDIKSRPWRALTMTFALNYVRARVDQFPQQAYNSFICFYATGPGCSTTVVNGTNPNTASSYGIVSGPGYYFPNAYTNPELFTPFTRNAAGVPTSYLTVFPGGRTRVQNTPDWSMQFGASYAFDLGSRGTITPEFHTLWSDEYILSPLAPNYTQDAYFKTDARITWRDPNGRASVQVFVNNLENVITIGRITTGSAQVAGTYSDPRTYGVRVGYHF